MKGLLVVTLMLGAVAVGSALLWPPLSRLILGWGEREVRRLIREERNRP